MTEDVFTCLRDYSTITDKAQTTYTTVSNQAPISPVTQIVTSCFIRTRNRYQLQVNPIIFDVIPGDTQEIIIGKDTLRELGLDCHEVLERFVLEHPEDPEEYYNTEEEDDDSWTGTLEIGPDTQEEWEEAASRVIDNARENGLSEDGCEKMRALLVEYRGILRLRYGCHPPIVGEPAKLPVDDSVVPVKTKTRRYNYEAQQWMNKFVRRAYEYGYLERCETATWISSPVIVKKANGKDFRMTLDLKAVNAATRVVGSPMQTTNLTHLRACTSYFSLDCLSGYWQVELHPSSRHYHTFQWEGACYSMCRLSQGGCNSAQIFHGRVAAALAGTDCRNWIDDIIGGATSEIYHIKAVAEVFERCRRHNIILSLKKCNLYAPSVVWCGKRYSYEGIEFEPRRLSGLSQSRPEDAEQLSTYIHSVTWISQSLCEFGLIVTPLRTLLNAAHDLLGHRKKSGLSGITLATKGERPTRGKYLEWEPQHQQAFDKIQLLLAKQTKLAQFDPDLQQCLFTDASDDGYSIIITQRTPVTWKVTPKSTYYRDGPSSYLINQQFPADEKHSPLCFISSPWKGPQRSWSTPEKECYAVFKAIKDCSDLVYNTRHPLTVYTDHRNLLFMYIPPSKTRSALNMKLERWSSVVAAVPLSCVHVTGKSNVYADMLSRWGIPRPKPIRRIQASSPLSTGGEGPDHPLSDQDPISTSILEGIRQVARMTRSTVPPQPRAQDPLTETSGPTNQNTIATPATPRLNSNESPSDDNASHELPVKRPKLRKKRPSRYNPRGKTTRRSRRQKSRSPDALRSDSPEPSPPPPGASSPPKTTTAGLTAKEILRRIVYAHCGRNGHRGTYATVTKLQAWNLSWQTMREDVAKFISTCIICACTDPTKPHRPIALTLHSDKPNGLVHFDYLFLGQHDYLICLKDDMSGYCLLQLTESPTAVGCAKALSSWISLFSTPQALMSDNGTHFCNTMLGELAKLQHTEHHFTWPNHPRTNGSVERLVKELVRTFRVLRLETGIKDTARLVDLVMSILNQSPLKRLKGRSSLTAFTGMTPRDPLQYATPVLFDALSTVDINKLQNEYIDDLKLALDEMHKEISTDNDRRRQAAIDAHNAHTNVRKDRFPTGSYVLYIQLRRPRHKLQRRWSGPYQIVGAPSQHIFELKCPLTARKFEAHWSCLKYYTDELPSLWWGKEWRDFQEPDVDFEIDFVCNHRLENGQWELKIRWRGFSSLMESWEPLSKIAETAEATVRAYIINLPLKKPLNRKIQAHFLASYAPLLQAQPSEEKRGAL